MREETETNQGSDARGRVDVSALAREAGITRRVLMTSEAWELCVALSPTAIRACNDETGRLWDVLWMLGNAARHGGRVIHFAVMCVTTRETASTVRLKAVCTDGDDGKPVLTVMLPHES